MKKADQSVCLLYLLSPLRGAGHRSLTASWWRWRPVPHRANVSV